MLMDGCEPVQIFDTVMYRMDAPQRRVCVERAMGPIDSKIG